MRTSVVLVLKTPPECAGSGLCSREPHPHKAVVTTNVGNNLQARVFISSLFFEAAADSEIFIVSYRVYDVMCTAALLVVIPFSLMLSPHVHLPLGNAMRFLAVAGQKIASKFAPLLLDVTLELFPAAFYTFPVHD